MKALNGDRLLERIRKFAYPKFLLGALILVTVLMVTLWAVGGDTDGIITIDSTTPTTQPITTLTIITTPPSTTTATPTPITVEVTIPTTIQDSMFIRIPTTTEEPTTTSSTSTTEPTTTISSNSTNTTSIPTTSTATSNTITTTQPTTTTISVSRSTSTTEISTSSTTSQTTSTTSSSTTTTILLVTSTLTQPTTEAKTQNIIQPTTSTKPSKPSISSSDPTTTCTNITEPLSTIQHTTTTTETGTIIIVAEQNTIYYLPELIDDSELIIIGVVGTIVAQDYSRIHQQHLNDLSNLSEDELNNWLNKYRESYHHINIETTLKGNPKEPFILLHPDVAYNKQSNHRPLREGQQIAIFANKERQPESFTDKLKDFYVAFPSNGIFDIADNKAFPRAPEVFDRWFPEDGHDTIDGEKRPYINLDKLKQMI